MDNQSPEKPRPSLILIVLLLLIPWILWVTAGDCAWATPGQSPLNQTVPPRKPTPPEPPLKPTASEGDQGGGSAAEAPAAEITLTPTSSVQPAREGNVLPTEEGASPPGASGTVVVPDIADEPDQDVIDGAGVHVQEEAPPPFQTPLYPSDRHEGAETVSAVREREDRAGRGITATQLGMCVIPVAGVFLLLLGAILWIRAGAR